MPKHDIVARPSEQVTLPGGTTLQFEGLGEAVAVAHWTTSGSQRFRSPADEDCSSTFRSALAELDIHEHETIHADVPKAPRFRGQPGSQPRFPDRAILRLRQPSEPGAMLVVLYQDESGGMSWHFPDGLPSSPTPLRSERGLSFTISTRTQFAQQSLLANQSSPRLRGPITKWGRKIFKILLIRPLDKLAGPSIEMIVGRIERKYRQELIRGLTAENYRAKVGAPFTDWRLLDGRRSLLVIHGIFSTTEGCLSQFPQLAMRELAAKYSGRMISFDQQTVHRSPEDNARFFLQTLQREAPKRKFEFDILCHSRGGIVARTLVERGRTLVPEMDCSFGNVFFVGTPNNGSVLGNPSHIVEMIDVFTNLLTAFPDGPVNYSIEVILALVKLIALSAEQRLPGIAAMGTDSYITRILNPTSVRSPAVYAAASSDYEPDPSVSNGFLTSRFGAAAMDRIFRDHNGNVANDLVVPTESVCGANGNPWFPITKGIRFGRTDHISHTGYFRDSRTLDAIKAHFGLLGSSLANVVVAEMPSFSPSPSRGHPAAAAEPYPEPSPSASRSPKPGGNRPRFRGESSPDAPPSVERDGIKEGLGPKRGARTGIEKTPAERADSLPTNPLELRREPHISFHGSVREGEKNSLEVSLRVLAATVGANTIEAILEPGTTEARVDVTLRAPGFSITPSRPAQLILKPDRDLRLERVSFEVTAHSPGPVPRSRELRAEFWQGTTCLGSVCHHTTVIPTGWTGAFSPDGRETVVGFSIRTPREQCDLCILVQGEEEDGMAPFRMSMSSIIPGEEFTGENLGKLNFDDSRQSLGDYLDQIYTNQFNRFPPKDLDDSAFANALAAWESRFNAELDGLGRTLWNWLPKRFREKYIQFYSKGIPVRSILVSSDEMILPWELIIPHGELDGQPFELPPLGRRHIIGRWKPGAVIKPQPQRFPVRRFCVVNPPYPDSDDELPAAMDEVREVQRLFPRATVVSPADFATVQREVLSRDDVHFFHFSGHGTFQKSNSDLSALQLLDGDLSALTLNGARFLRAGSPVVYLNACHAGAAGNVVGRVGGFGANLVGSGCSGVIAPYWPVMDEQAALFARKFYEKLRQERSVGEALQELREAHPLDPTFRAFSYLGDPWTRFNFEALS